MVFSSPRAVLCSLLEQGDDCVCYIPAVSIKMSIVAIVVVKASCWGGLSWKLHTSVSVCLDLQLSRHSLCFLFTDIRLFSSHVDLPTLLPLGKYCSTFESREGWIETDKSDMCTQLFDHCARHLTGPSRNQFSLCFTERT